MIDFKLKRGMNFDHQVSTPGKGLAQEKYIKLIKDNGFDHIRLPFWFEDCNPSEDYLNRIAESAKMVTDQGLYAFVDVHPLVGMNKDPQNMKHDLYKLWESLSTHLKDADEKVIFEIFNEPNGAFDAELLNEVQNECIRIIRKTNPTRLIAAACAEFNTVEHVHHLQLPEDDENIFVTLHCYAPMEFSHQAAPWYKVCKWPKGATWGTEEDYKAMEHRVKLMADWGKANNRHIHLGEFGIIALVPDDQRAEWTGNIIRLCEENGIAWCYWDFVKSFAVYDEEKDEWNKTLLDVMIRP